MSIEIGKRTKNLIGQKFNKLTVIGAAEKSSGNQVQWLCQCDCGNLSTVRASLIVRGHTKSCGCIKSESVSKTQTTHGMSATRQYKIWAGMLRRCYNLTETAYERYGGRGIRVFPSWHTFEGFWKDMGNSYEDSLTLERKDINGDYCPDNCEWISMQKQAMNRGIQSNNLLGIANVKIMTKGCDKYLQGRIKNPNTGKEVCRVLKIDKYGYEKALAIVKEWLRDKKKEFGYGECHGEVRENFERG